MSLILVEPAVQTSDFKLNGTFKTCASFLFLPNEPLNASTDLQCHYYINLDDFMIKSNASSQAVIQEMNTSISLHLCTSISTL